MLTHKQLSSYVVYKQSESSSEQLAVLDLSHKQLRKIPQITLSTLNITNINLSYNFIKSLGSIKIVSHDIYQNLQDRQLSLQWLDVSFNVIDNIDMKTQTNSKDFQQLKYLNACTNKIQTANITDRPYANLKYLHLKNNKIKFFINCPQNLKVLTLDKNQLTDLAFTGGSKLQVLSASHNKIQKIAVKTPQLLSLILQSNQILRMDWFFGYLQQTKKLLSINLIQNPISSNKQYKIIILSTLSKIVQINQIYINPHVRQGFRILKQQQKLQQVLERTTQNYKRRLEAQLQYKQAMLQKLKLQQKQIQQKFRSYCQGQKQQMDLLQKFAKDTLAQEKFKIADEKNKFINKVNKEGLNNQNKILAQDNEKKSLQIDKEQMNYRRSFQQFQMSNPNQANNLKQSNISQQIDPITESQNEDDDELNKNNDKNFNNEANQSNNDWKQNMKKPMNKQQNKLANSRQTNKNYRMSRDSINPLNLKQVQKMNNPQKNDNKSELNKKNVQNNGNKKNQVEQQKKKLQKLKKIKLNEIINLGCIKFLQKHYSFYE